MEDSAASKHLLFTVFTPSYNRAKTLHRVYESLKAQTLRDFEWLIIDDGSSDETGEIVRRWTKEATFPIRYYWQQNQGKHVAFNLAVFKANGALFLTLDSDDSCVPEALERFKKHWERIPEDKRPRYSAVTALCKNPSGRIVGDRFPDEYVDSTPSEIRYRYKVSGEKWGFQRTDVLRQFPFPVPGSVKYVPEGVVWKAIGRRYLTRYVNEPLRIYYPPSGTNAISAATPERYAEGLYLWHQDTLNQDMRWFRYSPKEFFRSALHLVRFGLHARKGLLRPFTGLRGAFPKGLWLVSLPFGLIAYWRDRIRRWKRIVMAQRRPLRFLVSRVLMKTRLCRLFRIRGKDHELVFFPTSLSAALWIDPGDRSEDVRFVRSYLNKGDVFVDVGANIGQLSIVGARVVGPQGKVYSIEAHPRVFRYLTLNLLRNDLRNVDTVNCAVGESTGSVRFSDKRQDDMNAVALDGAGIEVPMCRLDDLVPSDTRIRLLKVDVEGFERAVLLGARSVLARTDCVYFESWERHFSKYGHSTRDVTCLLAEQGFRVFRPTEDGLEPVDRSYTSHQCENLVAARENTRVRRPDAPLSRALA